MRLDSVLSAAGKAGVVSPVLQPRGWARGVKGQRPRTPGWSGRFKARPHDWEPGEMEAGSRVTRGIKAHFEKLHVRLVCFYEMDVMGNGPGKGIAIRLPWGCGSFSL